LQAKDHRYSLCLNRVDIRHINVKLHETNVIKNPSRIIIFIHCNRTRILAFINRAINLNASLNNDITNSKNAQVEVFSSLCQAIREVIPQPGSLIHSGHLSSCCKLTDSPSSIPKIYNIKKVLVSSNKPSVSDSTLCIPPLNHQSMHSYVTICHITSVSLFSNFSSTPSPTSSQRPLHQPLSFHKSHGGCTMDQAS